MCRPVSESIPDRCRLAPAYQGMKMRPGRWKCLGVMGATPPLWIPALQEIPEGSCRFIGCSGIRPSLIRERDMLPDQSLVPVAAGPPRYEKRELWVGTANWDGGFCHAAPRPQRGTSPRATFSHSAIGHRPSVYNSARFARGEPASRLIGGHIFVRLTNSVAGTIHFRTNR